MIADKLQFWGYRLGTIVKSFKVLYTLPPEKVQTFVDSYKIYDYDWADEKKMIEDMGPNYYQTVQQKLVDWYSVLNHLCAIGQVEKMYIPPAMDLSKSIIENQVLLEQRLSRDLGLKKGMKVLDVGCGRGRVASHIARYSGAHVTGMNIDHDQLNSAKRFIAAKGLTEKCHFMYGDLNELPLPFADNSLDAVYHIQVFSLAKDLPKLFKEIQRVLKPGGRFGCLEWIVLEAYDGKNPHHLELMRRIKPLVGAIGEHTIPYYEESMRKGGLKVLTSENASVNGLQSALIDNADKFYNRLKTALSFLIKCKILPKHFQILFDRFTQDGQAFVEADRMRLLTTSHYFIAEKEATAHPKEN
jgi:sterol 24-C-methyltransferase